MIPARLPYRIGEYAPRLLWSSPEARELWAPRFQRISAVYLEVERETVAAGVRPGALQNATPEQLPALMQALAPRGLVALPLAQTARSSGYVSGTRPTRPGDVLDYRVAICRPEHTAEWARAWTASDNDAIGRLLGYPECCRAFFRRVWVEERWFDTTWPQALNTRSATRVGTTGISIPATAPVNLLHRWHGIRPVSHLPCAFDCAPSLTMYEVALGVMLDRWPEEAAWLRETLNWPTEWSALFGSAEIVTPVCRTVVATDATSAKLVVRFIGEAYPEHGASGLAFPFVRNVPKPAKLLTFAPRPDPATNGFASADAMRQAHDALLAVIAGRTFNTVLDLGCGDGTLLSRIPAKRRIGVESDAARAAKAAKRIDRVVVGDCTDRALVERVLAEEQPDLILAQAARNPPEALAGRTVLSYSYEVPRFATLVNT